MPPNTARPWHDTTHTNEHCRRARPMHAWFVGEGRSPACRVPRRSSEASTARAEQLHLLHRTSVVRVQLAVHVLNHTGFGNLRGNSIFM